MIVVTLCYCCRTLPSHTFPSSCRKDERYFLFRLYIFISYYSYKIIYCIVYICNIACYNI